MPILMQYVCFFIVCWGAVCVLFWCGVRFLVNYPGLEHLGLSLALPARRRLASETIGRLTAALLLAQDYGSAAGFRAHSKHL